MYNRWLFKLFPLLHWFPVNSIILRSDVITGITGGLVLAPKAMAYAQLSGLPLYFGLYLEKYFVITKCRVITGSESYSHIRHNRPVRHARYGLQDKYVSPVTLSK